MHPCLNSVDLPNRVGWWYRDAMPHFRAQMIVAAPLERVWAFHSELGNLVRLFPRNFRPHVLKVHEHFEKGSEFVLRVGLGYWLVYWHGRIVEVDRPRRFVDEQVSGPFATWRHEHRLEPLPDGRTRVTETIDYQLSRGPLGALMNLLVVRWQLKGLFRFRRLAMKRLLEDRHPRCMP
jgi:ligand-binding SRPBCC domain-containing protein